MNQKDLPAGQAGIIALAIPVILIIAAIIVAYILFSQKLLPIPFSSVFKLTSTPIEKAKVDLKKDYANPFDKNSQYINPFSEYKNPFDSLK